MDGKDWKEIIMEQSQQSGYEEALQQRLTELQNETDAEFVRELIDIYIAEVPAMVQAIQNAVSQKDFPRLQSSAHALKGSSLNLGAKRVGAICLELEIAGRTETLPPSNERLAELQKELGLLITSFEIYKKKQNPR
jgi:histidine phosphotransfer protein HptB